MAVVEFGDTVDPDLNARVLALDAAGAGGERQGDVGVEEGLGHRAPHIHLRRVVVYHVEALDGEHR